jgi:hypothetical protein
MINAMIHNPEDRIKSYELLSKVWFEWFYYKWFLDFQAPIENRYSNSWISKLK